MMNKKDNVSGDVFSELREELEIFRNSLTEKELIGDKEIRRAMRGRSVWLNRIVVAEFITLPLLILFLLWIAYSTGMSIWVSITFALFASVDTILDLRTLAVSEKWIQDETLLSLSEKLSRQKIERQRQTFIGAVLIIPWIIWFTYEYLKHCVPNISEEDFAWVWGSMSALWIIIGAVAVIWLYVKAQRTNDELIQQINIFRG